MDRRPLPKRPDSDVYEYIDDYGQPQEEAEYLEPQAPYDEQEDYEHLQRPQPNQSGYNITNQGHKPPNLDPPPPYQREPQLNLGYQPPTQEYPQGYPQPTAGHDQTNPGFIPTTPAFSPSSTQVIGHPGSPVPNQVFISPQLTSNVQTQLHSPPPGQNTQVFVVPQPQTQPQTVIVTQQPPVSHAGYIVLACMVFWFCNILMGFIAFILSMVSISTDESGDKEGARKLNKASMWVSISGIIMTVIIIVICIVIAVQAASNYAYSYNDDIYRWTTRKPYFY